MSTPLVAPVTWTFNDLQEGEQAATGERDAPRQVFGEHVWFRRQEDEDGAGQNGEEESTVDMASALPSGASPRTNYPIRHKSRTLNMAVTSQAPKRESAVRRPSNELGEEKDRHTEE